MMTKRAMPAAAVLLAITALALVGCTPGTGTGAPSQSPSASAEAPDDAGEPSAAPTFSATCDEVLSPEAIYEFNPNLALDVEFAPASGSMASRLAAIGGVVCGWVNLTSGVHLAAAIAETDAASRASLEADVAAASTPTDAFGTAGYFAVAGGVGEAVAFVDGAVIVVAADDITEAADAAVLMEAAIAAYGG